MSIDSCINYIVYPLIIILHEVLRSHYHIILTMLISHHHHYHFTTNNIITVVIKPYCEDYRVNESNGSVTVCLMKDLETADDLNVTFEAKQKTPPDALCKVYIVEFLC